MTLQFAIVESNKEHSSYLLSLIRKWECEQFDACILVDTFFSGKDFMETGFQKYQLIFLNIELDGASGLDISYQLREENYKGELVLTTSHLECALDGYDVHALHCLLKPISGNKLFYVLSYVKNNIRDSYFFYHISSCSARLLYRDIVYFSSSNQYVEIYTRENKIKIRDSLKHISENLPSHFVQCHRTIIINIFYISKIEKRNAHLIDGTILPVSQTFLTPLQNAFLDLA